MTVSTKTNGVDTAATKLPTPRSTDPPTHDQTVNHQVVAALQFMKYVYDTFGMTYKLELSTRLVRVPVGGRFGPIWIGIVL